MHRGDVILYGLRKKVDVGYCVKLSVVIEKGLTAVRVGGGRGGSFLENEVNTGGLSINKNECSVASCVIKPK